MPTTTLQPELLWQHFATLCRIPRASGHEAALREYLLVWAARLGLDAEVDAVGNILIRKLATPGMEDRVGVVWQGHIDMVIQQNAGGHHDFSCDPIRPEVVDAYCMPAEQPWCG